jgi:transcriptional regulator with PAS, ATPase and Fis domain
LPPPSEPPPGPDEQPSTTATESLRLDDVEQRHIRRVLALAGGSKTRAAAMLGVSRSTLWEKTKRYQIE